MIKTNNIKNTITVKNLTKSFKKVSVLKGVDFCVERGSGFSVLFYTLLSEEIRKMEQEMIGAEKWVELIKENAVPKELTATLLNTMIEKILIHAPEIDDNGEKTQEIEIYYRFIGKID